MRVDEEYNDWQQEGGEGKKKEQKKEQEGVESEIKSWVVDSRSEHRDKTLGLRGAVHHRR